MPGYELMGQEELAEIQDIFDHGAVLFRHGFDAMRQGRYKVKEFEAAMAQRLAANGNVAAWQEASIGAESNGLRLTEVRVNVGDSVKAG